MAKFDDLTITNNGLDMIALSQSGAKLIFTKIKLGDGQIGDNDVMKLTDIINERMTSQISSIEAKGEGQVAIKFTVDNSELTSGFFVREIGIFAKINEGGEEKLYAYTNAGNYTNYLADNKTPIDAIITKIDLAIGNATDINFTVDKSIIYVSLEDLETNLQKHNSNIDSHTEAFTKHNDDENAHDNLIKKLFGSSEATLESVKEKVNDWAKEVCLPLSGGEMTGDITANNVYANNNVLVFNNVVEMKASNKIKAGYTLKTLGFYDPNDGGGADYLVIDNIGEDEVDEASIITLQNSLYAKLLIQDVLNIKTLGAYADGEHDDTSIINKAFDVLKSIMIEVNSDAIGCKYYVAPTLYIPKGVYKVTDTITFYMGANSVIADGATFFYDSSVLNALKISSFYSGDGSGFLYHTIGTCKIEGLRLICNNFVNSGTDSVGVLFGSDTKVPKNMLTFENVYVTGFNTSLKWGSDTWNVVFIKCSFFEGNINIHFPKDITNDWERCDFYYCTFSGARQYTVLSEFPHGQINFTNCSFDYHLGVVIRLTAGCRCYLNGCWIEWSVLRNKNYIAEIINENNSIFSSLFIVNSTIVPMYKDSSSIADDEKYEHGLFYSDIPVISSNINRLGSIYIENTYIGNFEAPEIITGGGDIQFKNMIGGDYGATPAKIKEDVYDLSTIPFIPYGLRTDQTDAYTVNLDDGVLSITVINKSIEKRPIFMLDVKDTEFFTLELSLKGNKRADFDVIMSKGYGYVDPITGEFVKVFTYGDKPYLNEYINNSVSSGTYVDFTTDMWYEKPRLTDKCPFPLLVWFDLDFSKASEAANGLVLSFNKVEIRRRVAM